MKSIVLTVLKTLMQTFKRLFTPKSGRGQAVGQLMARRQRQLLELGSLHPGMRQMVIGLLEEAEQRERKLWQLQHWVEQLLRARYGPR